MALIAISFQSSKSFDSAVNTVFGLLGLQSGEKRYSDNYEGGEYVRSQALGVDIKFYRCDEAELPTFQFMISLTPSQSIWIRETKKLDELAEVVARLLASHEMRLARLLGVAVGSPVAFYDGDRVWIENSQQR